ncbi:MAG: type II secretion system protein GspN [Nitrospirota bacterium]
MLFKHRYIKPLLFAGYFVLAFIVFLFLLFPVNRIKAKIESEVRQRTPFELSISHITPRFLNRIVLHDVVLSDRNGRVLFESPSIKTTISLWGLLRGVPAVDLKAEAYGGELLVKAQEGSNKRYLFFDANGLDISLISLLKNAGLQVAGKFGGNFEMTGDTGKGKLWLKGLALRQLKIKGFALPDMDFDQCWLDADFKGDRMLIKKFELDGKDLKVRCVGDMVLHERGSLNLMIKFKPSERIAREQAMLMTFLKNKDSDGFYQISLGGTLDAPIPRF